MTDALGQINDRLARAARANELSSASFYCECGNCLAEDVPLSLEEHEEIRARDDLIFAPGHELRRPDRTPHRGQGLTAAEGVRKGTSPVRTRPFAAGRQWLDNAPYVIAQRLPDL